MAACRVVPSPSGPIFMNARPNVDAAASVAWSPTRPPVGAAASARASTAAAAAHVAATLLASEDLLPRSLKSVEHGSANLRVSTPRCRRARIPTQILLVRSSTRRESDRRQSPPSLALGDELAGNLENRVPLHR